MAASKSTLGAKTCIRGPAAPFACASLSPSTRRSRTNPGELCGQHMATRAICSHPAQPRRTRIVWGPGSKPMGQRRTPCSLSHTFLKQLFRLLSHTCLRRLKPKQITRFLGSVSWEGPTQSPSFCGGSGGVLRQPASASAHRWYRTKRTFVMPVVLALTFLGVRNSGLHPGAVHLKANLCYDHR